MSSPRLRESALAVVGSTWLLGILAGLLSWSLVPTVAIGPSIDSSWVLGLQMALERGLHFGPEIIFTYGPLGFLQAPGSGISPYAELGGLYTLATRVALGLTLVWVARRNFGPLPSLLVALLVSLLLTTAPNIALALVWCLVALGPDSPARVRRLFPFIAGPVVALEALDKLSIGPVVLVICAITVLAMEGPRLRNALTFVATFVAAFLGLWLTLGQGISGLGEYAHSGYEIVTGYSSAMVAAEPNHETARAIAAICMTLTTLLVGYVAARRLPAARRFAVALILLLSGFAVWKMAFVRFGLPTTPFVFTVALPVWLAFPWRQVEMPRWLPGSDARALALAGLAAVTVLYFPYTEASLSTLNPGKRVETEVDQLGGLLLPDRLEESRQEARAELMQYFPLDRRTRVLLANRTVSVDQADAAIAWAYDLDWQPLPIFQAYAAYTPYLDRRNEEALLATDGPEHILRVASVTPFEMLRTNPTEVQSYNLLSNAQAGLRAWNQPQTTLAMLCNFKPLSTGRAFQLLTRGEDRCGAPRRIGSTDAGFGEEIPVPAPARHQLVFADVEGLAPTGWERLRTALYRAPLYRATVNGAVQYTMMPELHEGLLLRASHGGDFKAPFALAPQARTVRFDREGTEPAPSGLRVTFYALPVTPTAASPKLRGSSQVEGARGPRRSAAPRG